MQVQTQSGFIAVISIFISKYIKLGILQLSIYVYCLLFQVLYKLF